MKNNSHSGPFVRGADRCVQSIHSEYEANAKKAHRRFGAPGSSDVLKALRDMPQVRGIALGAFDEFSTSVDLLIEGLAHEGCQIIKKLGIGTLNFLEWIFRYLMMKLRHH